MKADLAIYTHVLGVPGQYESVVLMLSHKMDFYCCANRDDFRKSNHMLSKVLNHLQNRSRVIILTDTQQQKVVKTATVQS